MTSAASAIDAPRSGGFWRRLGWSLWPPRCLICGEAGIDGRDLCRPCAAAWPWMGPACLRCAMPLAGTEQQPPPTRIATSSTRATIAHTRAHAITSATTASAICGPCLRRPLLLTQLHAACAYRAPLDRLLPRFKFHRDLAAGRLLATMMAQAIAARFESNDSERSTDAYDTARVSASTEALTPTNDAHPSAAPKNTYANSGDATQDPSLATLPIVVPIPLHRSRLRERGYDQALELARPLARELRLPLVDDALIRVRNTPAQSRLDAAHRRRNLRDAFAWRSTAPIPAHVVLVDDVMTTGATLHAAARTLRRAGVQRVDAWVCARVL